jgi:hypothetical protein
MTGLTAEGLSSPAPCQGGVNFTGTLFEGAAAVGGGRISGTYSYDATDGWTYQGRFWGPVGAGGVGGTVAAFAGNSDNTGSFWNWSAGVSAGAGPVVFRFSFNTSGTTAWAGLGASLEYVADLTNVLPDGNPHATSRWRPC